MMDTSERHKWEQRYQAAAELPEACCVLREYRHLLPERGQALDLACGLGANALLLARHGLETHAWDISENALRQLRQHARRAGCEVFTQRRDVLAQPPEPESFEVICVCRFLERDLAPALCAALRPGGLLFYQTFTRTQVNPGGPANPAYLLADNELLSLFAGLRLLVYREEDRFGDLRQGWRDQALLIAARY